LKNQRFTSNEHRIGLGRSTRGRDFSVLLTPETLTFSFPYKEGNKMDKQTTGMSLAQQRKEIHALLNKLSHPDKAGESYDLALHYGIHEPWISLCAYNLAHSLLAKGADQGSLLKAERLFQRSMEVTPVNIYYTWLEGDVIADCPNTLTGDVDGDCRVNLNDYALLAQEWLTCALDPISACTN